jgi:lipopolysaccharide/colanic/teichoic acid biosynthesis glycosyltransferase
VARFRDTLYRATKRAIDIGAALGGLLVSAPIMGLLAIALKAESRGPLFYSQFRLGQGNRPFRMYKFRSMQVGSDSLRWDESFETNNTCDGPVFKIPDDPRVTRVGRFIRRWNLDEIPQLWNVLIGDMSLVGPRPLEDRESTSCPTWREARLSVPQGITGLWQTTRRSTGNFADWIEKDAEYVERRSLWLDLKILLGTLLVLAGWRSGRADRPAGVGSSEWSTP